MGEGGGEESVGGAWVMPDVAGDEHGWWPVAGWVILHPTVGLLRDAHSSVTRFLCPLDRNMSSSFLA